MAAKVNSAKYTNVPLLIRDFPPEEHEYFLDFCFYYFDERDSHCSVCNKYKSLQFVVNILYLYHFASSVICATTLYKLRYVMF